MHKAYVQFICAMFLSFTFATSTYAINTVSESDAKDLIESFHSAIEEQDMDTIGEFFAKNAKIEMIMPASLGGQKVKLNVSNLLQMLEKTWRIASAYTYQLEDFVTTVSADKETAYVTNTVTETIEVRERTLTTKTQEQTTLSIIDGELLITKFIAKTKSITINNQE
jgi:hypothetical protein